MISTHPDTCHTNSELDIRGLIKAKLSESARDAVRRLCDMQEKAAAMDRTLEAWGMTWEQFRQQPAMQRSTQETQLMPGSTRSSS